MTIDTVAFPIAFSLIAAILLWFVIGSKGKWGLKALTIIIAMATSIFLWSSLGEIEGWPTSNPVPKNFKLLAFSINEPNKAAKDNGAIYIWILGAGNKTDQPRAYLIPYERKLHEQLEEAGQGMKKGRFIAGKVSKEGSDGYKGLGLKQEFVFYELPPAKLPEKKNQ